MNKKIMGSIASKIKGLQNNRSLTKMANESGLSLKTIRDLKNCNKDSTTIDTLCVLAEYFDCDLKIDFVKRKL